MDSLIGILVLIGIFSSLSKKKKKQAQKQADRQQAPKPAKPSAQAKIPFTKDEWTAFLTDMEKQEKKHRAKPAKPARAAKPVKAPAPVLHLDHDEPEGTISTQGESAAEHAEHRQKILAEEAKLREQQQTLQELRHLNRQKLRSAVVMSEVLGKPVSLRPRGYR
ncbi:MAG: hypothetical protein J6J78_08460 [Clostridia bacterium]|nr:hypothetical protein [Clostridia bacterium]MBP3653087.1 hypothetical protein [Clostridia bacterium]